MTAATVNDRFEVNNPTEEVVLLTVTDGETYVSKKFAVVQGAQASFNEDVGSQTIPISLAVSGGTVTIHCAGVTDKKICLALYGRK